MSGKPTKIDIDKRTQLDVRCQVWNSVILLYPFFRIHTSLSDLLKEATATCANQCSLTMLFLAIQTKS
jgi:hypothetical protein